jgi:hypothetical protein
VTEPVRVGQPFDGVQPVELPDRHTYNRCGHCGGDGIIGDPEPETWVPGLLDPGQSERFAVLHKCYTCDLPTVVTWTATRGPDGFAELTGSTQSPFPAPPDLKIREYAGTAIELYYAEAWRCRVAGLRRASMVMARATLQACYRRYLASGERGSYTAEMKKVAELAGPGWAAIATGVRDFGNQWAHPEGTTSPPSWAEVQESFRRMKSVLDFTAEMERVGHMKPTGQPPHMEDTGGSPQAAADG